MEQEINLKISFLNVGQGDSIVLNWGDNLEHIGFIDCKLDSKKGNPSLDYLKTSSYKKIEFIILTHPHFDHYSGLLELLEYCDNNSITIETFIHSADGIKNYVNYFLDSKQKNLLGRILIKANYMRREEKIKDFWPITYRNSTNLLIEKLDLTFISPSFNEFDECIRYFSKDPFEDSKKEETYTKANYLSIVTLIKLNKKKKILLTADCDSYTFIRLNRNDIQEDEFELIQVSHHGSNKNFVNKFWKKNIKSPSTKYAVISVGENKHGHPSDDVIKGLKNLSYTICPTNLIGSLLKPGNTTFFSQILLDSISTVGASKSLEYKDGNQVFQFSNGTLKYL